jgi:hypothetical protein
MSEVPLYHLPPPQGTQVNLLSPFPSRDLKLAACPWSGLKLAAERALSVEGGGVGWAGRPLHLPSSI